MLHRPLRSARIPCLWSVWCGDCVQLAWEYNDIGLHDYSVWYCFGAYSYDCWDEGAGNTEIGFAFRSPFAQYGAWAVLISFIIIIFFNGWTILVPYSASDFFSDYVNIPGFFLLYFGWKLFKRTSIVHVSEMDCTTYYEEGSVVLSRYNQ